MKTDSTYSNAQHTKNREYVKVGKMINLPNDVTKLRKLDSAFWKNNVFFHLLSFYKTYGKVEINALIVKEKKNKFPQVEKAIAKYIRNKLNRNRKFNLHFDAFGENSNDDSDIEGYYDITISNTYWVRENGSKVRFHFECKNLDNSQNLINKYVNYNTYKKDENENCKYDGGVLRFFNGKYAQDQDFGGMIGFVLKGDLLEQKSKIFLKMNEKFHTTPNGDLIEPIMDNSIEGNNFTFDTIHNRYNRNFILHHLLFDFS